MSEAQYDGVAIVGMAGRFPGAENVEEFWSNLIAGRETISFFSDAELAESGLDRAALDTRGHYVPARGVLRDADCFDAAFFGVHPREAEVMDPQQRVFLEACWTALEQAGYAPSQIETSVGVFAGSTFNTYYLHVLHGRPALTELVGPELVMFGNEKDFLTPRVAYKLGLRGPAVNISTACSTSLVAVCQACQSLVMYQCDMALAGGTSVTVPQKRGYYHDEGNIGSADGHTRTFDARATGTVFSNGVGVVVLKRLEDAVRDGDRIYAVIKGAALNNDGSERVSFSAPGIEGQADVIAMAHALAGFDPDTISYVEAHGTATPLGDPIEVAGLTKAFRLGTARRQFCALGSVKTNVGHLDVAAGVAGLIKTALALHHRVIPATLHFESPNPKLDLERSPFYVNASLQSWEATPGVPRRAGVSSFGTGGTNAHVVLEEAPALPLPGRSRPWQVLTLSAKTPEALERATENLVAHLRHMVGVADTQESARQLADTAFTLHCGRSTLAHRRTVVCRDAAEGVLALAQRDAKRVFTHHQQLVAAPVVFMFPGQGAQYPGMGAELYDAEPLFRDEVDRCAELLAPVLERDLRDVMFARDIPKSEAQQTLQQTRFTQPALFVTEYALAKLWMSWGVKPTEMIGHSVGEYVAGCLAGVFTLEDALSLVARRGTLVQAQPSGAMLAVRLSEEEISPLLGSELAVAAVNSPTLCVVSGPHHSVDVLELELKSREIAARRLHTSHAFHSPMMDPVLAPFRELLEQVTLGEPQIRYVSNVTARWITAAEATNPGYWAGHVRDTVRFSDGVAELMTDARRILLEVGPGQTLSTLARQHPAKSPEQTVLASLPIAGSEELRGILETLGWLSTIGARVDWPAVYAGQSRRRVCLPTYPFERKRHWPDGPVAASAAVPEATATGAGLPCATVPVPAAAPEIAAVSAPLAGPVPSPVFAPEPAGARKARLAARVRVTLEELSGASLAGADATASFLELGLDSLLLTQASTRLHATFGVRVSFRQLMEELSSVEELSGYLDKALPPEPAPVAARPAAAPATAVATAKAPAVDSAPLQTKAFGPFKSIDKSASALTGEQQAFLDRLIARYTERTKTSKQHTQTNRRHFADPRTMAGFRPYWKEMVYPIVVERSSGARMWDVDGNEYIDFTMGFGTNLLGHSPAFVTTALEDQLRKGVEVGPQTPFAGHVAALMCELTGMERCAFVNTGSEAVMAAIRLARTVTARRQIVYFTGDYHGIFDEVLQRAAGSVAEQRLVPVAPGIPVQPSEHVLILNYNQPESLEIIRARGADIAAVVVEPVQSRYPDVQPRAFLQKLRDVTHQTGSALVFDEVITGFRAHQGGAQALFGIRADIATYGKVLGGGMPIGAVCGSAKYLDALDGGFWQYGDASVPEAGVTFFAGTYVRHPLAIAGAAAMLNHLKREGPTLQQRLTERMSAVVGELKAFLSAHDLPIRLEHFSSFFWASFEPSLKYANLLFFLLRDKGIHIFEGRLFFLSTAHTDADVCRFVQAFKESVLEMQAVKFLPGAPVMGRLKPAPVSALPTPAEAFNRPDTGGLASSSPYVAPVPSAGPDGRVVVARAPLGALPLTESQQGLWLLTQMTPAANRAYVESTTLRWRGPIDVDLMRRAMQTVVDRHEGLRATINPDGETQTVHEHAAVDLPMTDFSHLAAPDQPRALADIFARIESHALDLVNRPIIQAHVIRLAAEHHLLVLTFHHLYGNGPSYEVLFEELCEIYGALRDGRALALDPPLQMSAYVRWMAEQIATPAFEDDRQFWLQQFSGSVPVLNLPADRRRVAVMTFRGRRHSLTLDRALTAELRKTSGRLRTSLFMTLFAAFNTLVARLAGQDDIVVGVPFEGAVRTLPGGDRLFANTTNLIPLRSRLDLDLPFSEFLARTKSLVLEANEHQSYFFGRLVQDLRLRRDPSRPPIVAVLFNFERGVFRRTMGGATVELVLDGVPFANPADVSKFELSVNIADLGDGLRLDCDYSADLFDPDTVARWLGHYRTLLERITTAPDEPLGALPMLTAAEREQALAARNDAPATPEAVADWQQRCAGLPGPLDLPTDRSRAIALQPDQRDPTLPRRPDAERHQMLVDWNRTARSYPEHLSVHQLIEEQARHRPQHIAVSFGEERLTYSELNRRANQLAHYLVKLGVERDVLVGVCVERSTDMLVALLGILKAGGAYVPLDPAFPHDRLAYMVQDSGMRVLVTHRGLGENLSMAPARIVRLDAESGKIAKESPHDLVRGSASSEDLAYIIYTSGSTGRPKGVQIAHRSLVNLLSSMRREPGLSSDDVLLAVTTLSFDIAGLELFLPLTTGATVAIAPREAAGDAVVLRTEMERSLATVVQATPVTWRLLLQAGWPGDPRLRILCGGEAMSRDLAEQLAPRCAELWNMYGPTETTIWSTCRRITHGQDLDIGRPIDNTEIFILDETREPVPIGVVGELFIGGAGLARGYHGRPELTAERFTAHPFKRGKRLYRTGDRARWRPGGTIEFLGRVDHQVKLRGLRVELGEIEATLQSHPAVREAVVLLREDRPGDQRLVAYVSGSEVSAADLRAHTRRWLPEALVPSAYVSVDSWPLTPNGKLNRHLLPPPLDDLHAAESAFQAPQTLTEQRLAVIWSDILGVTNIGVTDDFFLRGGHSLLAIRLVHRVHQEFGIALPPGALFEHPVLRDLARRIHPAPEAASTVSPATPQKVLVQIKAGGSGAPFFWVHGIGGEVFSYMPLSQHFAATRSVYGFAADWTQMNGGEVSSVEAMAAHYVREMRIVYPSGPYHLGGFCTAAMLAFEMARQLEAAGQRVGVLAVLDYELSAVRSGSSPLGATRAFLKNLPRWVREDAILSGFVEVFGRFRSRLRRIATRFRFSRPNAASHADALDLRDRLGMWRFPDYQLAMLDAHYRAIRAYQPKPFNGTVTLFLPRTAPLFGPWPSGHDPEWNRLALGGIEVHLVPGSHTTMLAEAFAEGLAARLNECIVKAERFGVRLNKKAETIRDRRLSRDEEKRLLDAALQQMNTATHQYVGELLHDRIIGTLELCCRRGEMLLIQNKRVKWDSCQIEIPGTTAKGKENRRIPFNPKGRLAAILKRRGTLGPDAYVFGSTTGAYQPTIQTAWETLQLLANGIEPKPGREGAEWNREQLQRIDLRWHDLRHEGACRLLADGVDIRMIQLMLGHASIQQTQRYLNVTDEELRRGLEVSWNNRGRPLRLASGG